MSLALLLADELRHLLRSRLVLLILGALPLTMAAGSFAQGETEMNPLIFAAFLGSSLAGMVCGAMVATSLIGELQQGMPVLFAIRPFPRWYLLAARFVALVLTLVGTMAVSLAVGVALSAWLHPEVGGLLYTFRSGLALSLACALLSGSFGVLVGVTTSSMLGGVMLFIFVGMQLSNGVMFLFDKLPAWTGFSPAERDASLVLGAIAVAALLMAISARLFARRPL